MSSSTSTNLTNRKNKSKSINKQEEDFEFNIVEESPDVATTSEEEEAEALLIPFKGLEEGSKEVEERVRRLSQVKVGFKGYLQVLDWYMLSLFFKLMFAFFFTSGILCLIYSFIVYLWFPEQWLEYFPISKQDQEL